MANPPRPIQAPVQVARIQGYDEFEVDLVKVLKEQLTVFFGNLGAAPLTTANVAEIPERLSRGLRPRQPPDARWLVGFKLYHYPGVALGDYQAHTA